MKTRLVFSTALLWSDSAYALERPAPCGGATAKDAVLVIGEVTSFTSNFRADNTGWIETRYDVAVITVVSGALQHDSLALVLPGGTVGDLSLRVAHTPSLALDSPYLLHLAPRRDGDGWRLVGGEEGARPFRGDAAEALAALELSHGC